MNELETHENDSASLRDISKTFDPARLIQARRVNKLSKTELHRRVGVSAAAIGQYERGEVTPRADTISALSEALHVPAGFFAHGRPKVRLDVAQASFRRLRATTVAQQQQAVAYVEQVWELATYLEERVEFPEVNLPHWVQYDDGTPRDAPDPITAAREVRKYWELGTDPIKFLIYELERHGILTVLFTLKEDDAADETRHIDAFSTSALPRPIIVLTPDKADDVLRHRFSAAHELGHLVLHHGQQSTDSISEREADAFAAEFLTPREELRKELPIRFNLSRLDELSQKWGASPKSLVFRSKELELISEATARRAYITLSNLGKAGVIQAQPINRFPGENPELLKNAIELLDEANVPLTQIARDLQMSPRHIHRLAGIEDVKPKLRLVR